MIDEGMKRAIETLAWEELQRANMRFPQFASTHEGYAIIKEEIEETEQELIDMKESLKGIWTKTKMNSLIMAKKHSREMRECALNLAAEAIQVAAMCDKFLNLPNDIL